MLSVFTYTPGAADWVRSAPEVIILVVALVVLLADLADSRGRHGGLLAGLALLGVVGAGIAATLLFANGDGQTAFNGMVSADRTALFADLIVLLAAAFGLLYSPGYIERQGITQPGEYYTLLLLSTLGMLLLASASNLMIVFAGLEVLSLALYLLSAYVVGRMRSQEAGMKYFLLSSFASAFLLYGMALTYGATGSTSLSGIRAFVSGHPLQPTSGFGPLLLAGLGLMAVGFCFKVSAVPFQAWTPDVYVGAPTPVTAFMSVGTKVAAFVGLARVYLIALHPVASQWEPIFWIVAVLTMIGGNVLAVTQRDVKRMLAYSSVANAGYMLVAVVTDTRQALASLLIYLAAYAAMNLGAFGVVLALERNDGYGTTLDDYVGLARRRPGLAATMALCLFALAGIPPTAGFAGKYFVFYAAIVGNHLELAIIGVLSSVLGIFYYLRVIWAMYFAEPSEALAPATVSAAPTAAENVSGARAQPFVVAPSSAASAVAADAAVAVAERATPVATIRAARATTQDAPTTLTLGTRVGLTLAVVLTLALGILPAFFDLARDAAASLWR